MDRIFGTLPGGEAVRCFTLTRGALSCEGLTYGAALRSLTVPDRAGKPVDVVLGYDELDSYVNGRRFLGAVAGRFANRIGGASFELGGKTYKLFANEGKNTLHGGKSGFNEKNWTAEAAGEDFVTLSLVSPDGDEGFPGTLRASVTYRLEEDGLRLVYRAVSDADTLCNLTNHSYFNLAGHGSGPVPEQTIRLFASRYTPTDAASIPTGEIAEVAGTPMDLREPTPIGAHIDEDFVQLRQAGGYDHDWLVDGEAGVLRPAAEAFSAATGIRMTVLTDRPAIQFYAGNFLGGGPAGKGGAEYGKRCGFCLETQCCPDAPHHPNLPGAFLAAGEEYHTETVFRFSTIDYRLSTIGDL